MSVACCWPAARSQTRTVPSSPPLTALAPSAVTATDHHRAFVAPERRLLLAGGQVPDPHRAVRPPLTALAPSAVTATDTTPR